MDTTKDIDCRSQTKECILLVEDDEAIRTTVAEYLRLEGYRIVTANSGDQAMRRLKAAYLKDELPDLIITDLLMPAGGSDFVKTLQDHSVYHYLPVLVVTASSVKEVHGLQVLSKPFDLNELCMRVRDCLRPRSLE